MIIALSLCLGLVAGFFSGFFGIGGGVIVTPCLYFLFATYSDIPDPLHFAVGSSLTSLVGTTAISFFSHWKRNNVEWAIATYLCIGAALGTCLGMYVGLSLPQTLLKWLLAFCLSAIGGHLIITHKRPYVKKLPPPPIFLMLIGLGVSTLSAMLGIGGGVLLVPLLSHLGIRMQTSIGASSSVTFCVMLLGALSFFVLTPSIRSETETAHLMVALQAIGSIFFASMALAPIGARRALTLRSITLKKYFGLFLIAIAGALIWRALRT